MSSKPINYAVLLILSLLYFLLTAGTFNSLGMVLPAMVKDFGMSWAQAGFGFTLLGVACGLLSLAPAYTVRKLGVARTMLAGTAVLLAGFGLLYLATGVAAYYLGTTLLGVGFCFCGTVPAVHVLSSIFNRRSTALGVYFTIGNLGAVFGPLLYYVSQSAGLSWRLYWLMLGLGAVVIGGLSVLITSRLAIARPAAEQSAEPAPASSGWKVRDALATPQFWVVIFAYTACLAINTTTHSFAYQHLLEHGLAADQATQFISLSALVCAIGSALAGVIGEKTSPRVLTMFSLGTLALSAATLALANGSGVLVVWLLAFGGGLGFSYVSTIMLLQEYFGRRAALELYSIMTAVSTSAALGPALGGMVRDQTGSFSGIFYALAGVSLVLFALVAMLRKPQPRGVTAHLAGFGAAEPLEG
ncbi:MFS transporter [Sphingomonas sp. H39-1-10]|uniref:MFS transporter n=1 Tax=Sphingomonas pollutisoli TaxID=3030829 RepID=UPI0023B88F58|nr:MFS transporter [Sphingomonas pollutisoli]MDF0487450.1 MFS transporter [Sphingomonas pollutisoli]